jgi:hypothetical protein
MTKCTIDHRPILDKISGLNDFIFELLQSYHKALVRMTSLGLIHIVLSAQKPK